MGRSTSKFGGGRSSGRRQKSWRDDPATDKQKEFIDELDLGYTKPALDALTKGEAHDIIEENKPDDDDDDGIPDARDVWD